MSDERTLQLKIQLVGADPPIWRRVRASESIRLSDLHRVIQIVMGWDNAHLHQFEIRGTRLTEFDEDIENGAQDSRTISLGELPIHEPNEVFNYLYDFGDDWLHQIVVESIGAAEPMEELPVCLDGKRACPPEDCGGIPGYERLIAAISNPENPDHSHLAEWVDPSFDPAVFDIAAVNQKLHREFADA